MNDVPHRQAEQGDLFAPVLTSGRAL
jgi:hypothetical protein